LGPTGYRFDGIGTDLICGRPVYIIDFDGHNSITIGYTFNIKNQSLSGILNQILSTFKFTK